METRSIMDVGFLLSFSSPQGTCSNDTIGVHLQHYFVFSILKTIMHEHQAVTKIVANFDAKIESYEFYVTLHFYCLGHPYIFQLKTNVTLPLCFLTATHLQL
jgi:hypothetical protein